MMDVHAVVLTPLEAAFVCLGKSRTCTRHARSCPYLVRPANTACRRAGAQLSADLRPIESWKPTLLRPYDPAQTLPIGSNSAGRGAIRSEAVFSRKRGICGQFARNRACYRQCPRHESNMRTRFRKPLLYPLSYGGALDRVTAASPGPSPSWAGGSAALR